MDLLNLSANVYNELFDNSLEIEYEGDIQKVVRFINDNAKKSSTQSLLKDDESESDEEMDYEKV